MLLRVTLLMDGRETMTVSLPADANPMIGREDSTNDIILHDSTISRVHARLVRRHQAVIVQDLGSRLGTLVNGKPVSAGGDVVGIDDIVGIGPFELRVEMIDWEYANEMEQTLGLSARRCPNPDCPARVPDGFHMCVVCGTDVTTAR